MFNNFTNINKTNHHLSPQIIEHKKDYHIHVHGKIWYMANHKTIHVYIEMI